MTARTDRIDALLRAEISELLTREVHDPRVGFATVTDVETSPDLGHARVWISVLGTDTQWRVTLRALERAMPFVRRRLGERLRLRRIPELAVRADHSAERGTRVLRLIEGLEEPPSRAGGAELEDVLPRPGPLPSTEWAPAPARRDRLGRTTHPQPREATRGRGHGRRR